MPKLTIAESSYNCEDEETVLDALIRQEVDVSHACKKGSCHCCMLRSPELTPPEAAQKGLKSTLKELGYFLSCLCVPEHDMQLKLPEQSDIFSNGKVLVNEMLNQHTMLLIVECQDILEYKAGQFVNLQRGDGLTRSYSIANIPQHSKTLEFHIKQLPGGQFTGWVRNELKVGDTVAVSEPQGHCFYLPERKEQGLLLVGTGSGLAPLAGILKDALSHGHSGPIHLFHGTSEVEDLYRVDEMRQLSADNDNFDYTPCISGKNVPDGYTAGRANIVALDKETNLKDWRVFLCGHPEMINTLKMDVFMQGVSMADIYTDAFLIANAE